MLRYRIVDEFETTVETYWTVFFDPNYNTALYDALDIEYEPLELRREGTGEQETIFRRIRLAPRRELPAVVRKFVQGAVSYEQRDRFSRKDNRIAVETVPSFLADRFISTGVYRVTASPPGVTRTWEGECSCKVPLIGGAVERFIVDEVERGYKTTTTFTRKWLREHAPNT